MKRLTVFGILTLAFVIAMIFWRDSFGIFQFPIMTLGCLSGFFLLKGLVDLIGPEASEAKLERERRLTKRFVCLIVASGGIGLFLQIILKILSVSAHGP